VSLINGISFKTRPCKNHVWSIYHLDISGFDVFRDSTIPQINKLKHTMDEPTTYETTLSDETVLNETGHKTSSRHVRFPDDIKTTRFINNDNTEPETFIRVCPTMLGDTTNFFVDQVESSNHTDTEEIMYATTPGQKTDVQTKLTRQVLHDLAHTISPDEKYKLICISKNNTSATTIDGVDMVFALVGEKTNFNSDEHNLRCIFYSKNAKNMRYPGERFIRLIKFPSATCQLQYLVSYNNDTPSKSWLNLLLSLKISETNTTKSVGACEKDWGFYLKQNSHNNGVSYCIIPPNKNGNEGVGTSTALGVGGVVTDLNVKFTREGFEHVVNIDAAALDLLSSHIVQKHHTIVSDVHCILKEKYEFPTRDSNFILTLTMPHATRVKCSLMEVSKSTQPHADNTKMNLTYIASTDVNFCNNMVYADMRAPGVENVFGIQRIALRISNRLQENLTPAMIARRIIAGPGETENLIKLMSSVDLSTDLIDVLQYQTIKCPKTRAVVAMINTGLFQKINYDRQAATSAGQLKTEQDHIFGNCNAFRLKRVTASISSERARWQDHHPVVAASDSLLRQRMTSARGVAVMSVLNEQSDIKTTGTYIQFYASTIPRLRLRKRIPSKIIGPGPLPTSSTTEKIQLYTTSRPLEWGTNNPVSSPDASKPTQAELGSDAKGGETQFFTYKYDKFSKAMQFLQGPDTIALFTTAENIKIEAPPNTPAMSVPPGSLVRALINLSNNSNNVYTRALAHKVLIAAVESCPLINTHINSQIQTMSWMNHYRIQFLKEIKSNHGKLAHILDEKYVDYSMFSQCLKDQSIGSRIPADMFGLLVQQSIPFPSI
jgi:hypothetical protein